MITKIDKQDRISDKLNELRKIVNQEFNYLKFLHSLEENDYNNLKEKWFSEFDRKMSQLLFSYDQEIDKIDILFFDKLKINMEKESENLEDTHYEYRFSDVYSLVLSQFIDIMFYLQKDNIVFISLVQYLNRDIEFVNKKNIINAMQYEILKNKLSKVSQ
jgi:hypothetical protein